MTSELKFVGPAVAADVLDKWLTRMCRPDPRHPENTIVSIYYDTWNMRHYHEKRGSSFLKRKIRVRYYVGGPDGAISERAFLEVKDKIGAQRQKFRMTCPLSGSRVATLPMRDRELAELTVHLRTHGFALPVDLMPAVEIRYRRKRYVDAITGTRLCLDTRIGAARWNALLLRSTSPVGLAVAVAEVKGELRQLPPHLRTMPRLGFRKGAFSKYEACCQGLMPGGAHPWNW